MDTLKRCPACGQSDQVAKVSMLYVEGMQRKRASRKEQPTANVAEKKGANPMPAVFMHLDATALARLGNRLKPPASGKELPIRPVHPDLIILVFSLAAPLFLYQIYASQPGTIYSVLAILVGFYGLYGWKRKSLLARFEREKDNRRAAEGLVKRGIERWMRLYYCARDEAVFTPGADGVTPADQMMAHLLQE